MADIRAYYTPRWVQHYRHRIGTFPQDTRWRSFHTDLCQAFKGLCGYCERGTRGEVDHFRPKSKFPEVVYSWPNLIFACHDCNHAKAGKWPLGGYIDPCARSRGARPERYFDFDTLTGEIVPIRDLTPRRRRKAIRTIQDLRLNEWHHLKERIEWLRMVSAAIPDDQESRTSEVESLRARLTSRETPLSSITRVWLSERGYTIVI